MIRLEANVEPEDGDTRARHCDYSALETRYDEPERQDQQPYILERQLRSELFGHDFPLSARLPSITFPNIISR